MKLQWGSYEFKSNGVKISASRTTEMDKANNPLRYLDKVEGDGYIEGSTQGALSGETTRLQAALRRPNQDLVFYQDDGQASAVTLRNAGSISGTTITDGPNFKDTAGPEFVSQRHFTFTCEADYPADGRFGKQIIEFNESIEIDGGGPLYVVLPAIEGPPQRQKIYDLTPCTATQSGYVIGFRDYPDLPPAIWPFAQNKKPKVKKVTPDRRGKRNYTTFRLEYSYEFAWTGPLFGVPTLWK